MVGEYCMQKLHQRIGMRVGINPQAEIKQSFISMLHHFPHNFQLELIFLPALVKKKNGSH
jgi:hypothetical protein